MPDRNYALEALRVTEAAAVSAAREMGRGDNVKADQVAIKAMWESLNSVRFSGRVVVGEGNINDTPLLYVGEEVGGRKEPIIEIALDPLEGSTIVASGGTNALSVIAIGEEGAFLQAPDTYMFKVATGPLAKGHIDITRTPSQNLDSISKALERPVDEITVVILDRPRHENLIQEIRDAGARIRLISDGDVAAAIATAKPGSGIDVLMGVGGAPEGVLAAAALKCMGGDFQGILKPRSREEVQRIREMGFEDIEKIWKMEDLASGNIMFAATGVTDGELLDGVKFFKGGAKTSSLVLRSYSRTIRYIESKHYFEFKPGM